MLPTRQTREAGGSYQVSTSRVRPPATRPNLQIVVFFNCKSIVFAKRTRYLIENKGSAHPESPRRTRQSPHFLPIRSKESGPVDPAIRLTPELDLRDAIRRGMPGLGLFYRTKPLGC